MKAKYHASASISGERIEDSIVQILNDLKESSNRNKQVEVTHRNRMYKWHIVPECLEAVALLHFLAGCSIPKVSAVKSKSFSSAWFSDQCELRWRHPVFGALSVRTNIELH